MNIAAFERAQIVAFAYREARYTGSLESMKAVCYMLRNRVKAGWGDGSWLSVISAADQVMGNLRTLGDELELSVSDRLLQLMVRDIDDIYLGQDFFGDNPTRLVACGDNPPKTAALYYMFVDRPHRPWFVENIVQKRVEHPHIGNVGPVMLFK